MGRIRRMVGRIGWLRRLAGGNRANFAGSRAYWESRYQGGGTSGAGSYGRLARFKADVLNAFVREQQVRSVIEFGCGDGNQLALAEYPSYIGLDVSRSAIGRCADRFADDPTKSFFLYDVDAFVDRGKIVSAELALSLDVLFHLVEDRVYERYMAHLFAAGRRFVIVYSSCQEGGNTAAHVRHRKFTDWVARHAPEWKLRAKIDNQYPFDPRQPDETSFADFYVFEPSHRLESTP